MGSQSTFTRNAMSSVMKFRQDIAQRRKSDNDKVYLCWMIGWATIAGAKKMASCYEEQLQDRVSPSAASHPNRSQPVNDVIYNKQIQVCTSPCVAAQIHQHRRETQESEELFFNTNITLAKEERTVMAKENTSNARRVALIQHTPSEINQELD